MTFHGHSLYANTAHIQVQWQQMCPVDRLPSMKSEFIGIVAIANTKGKPNTIILYKCVCMSANFGPYVLCVSY